MPRRISKVFLTILLLSVLSISGAFAQKPNVVVLEVTPGFDNQAIFKPIISDFDQDTFCETGGKDLKN